MEVTSLERKRLCKEFSSSVFCELGFQSDTWVVLCNRNVAVVIMWLWEKKKKNLSKAMTNPPALLMQLKWQLIFAWFMFVPFELVSCSEEQKLTSLGPLASVQLWFGSFFMALEPWGCFNHKRICVWQFWHDFLSLWTVSSIILIWLLPI